MKRTFDTLGWLLFIPIILWFTVPSSVFMAPKSIIYKGDEVTFVRETPFGPVYADWVTEIDLVSSPLECSSNGTSYYQVVSTDKKNNRVADTVQYTADESLMKCLETYGEKVIRHTWTVRLLGIVPLRPTDLIITQKY